VKVNKYFFLGVIKGDSISNFLMEGLHKKIWNPLWLSVLTLDFHDQNSFQHFVHSAMLTRDTTLPIQSFRLKCDVSPECDPHDINRFIRVAVQQGLESLVLDLSNTYCNFQIRLGPTLESVFSCRNLVVLKLKALLIRDNVVPKFHFPLLKTVHLASIVFFGDFNKLIEGCPF